MIYDLEKGQVGTEGWAATETPKLRGVVGWKHLFHEFLSLITLTIVGLGCTYLSRTWQGMPAETTSQRLSGGFVIEVIDVLDIQTEAFRLSNLLKR